MMEASVVAGFSGLGKAGSGSNLETLSDNPHCCGRTFRRVYAGRKIK